MHPSVRLQSPSSCFIFSPSSNSCQDLTVCQLLRSPTGFILGCDTTLIWGNRFRVYGLIIAPGCIIIVWLLKITSATNLILRCNTHPCLRELLKVCDLIITPLVIFFFWYLFKFTLGRNTHPCLRESIKVYDLIIALVRFVASQQVTVGKMWQWWWL